MRIEELAELLTQMATVQPGLKVKFRQGNGYLATVDEVNVEKDTFETWIELA